MACWCENKQAHTNLEWVRTMAKKTALLNDEIQVIYKEDDTHYNFCAMSSYEGEIYEFISNI